MVDLLDILSHVADQQSFIGNLLTGFHLGKNQTKPDENIRFLWSRDPGAQLRRFSATKASVYLQLDLSKI